MQFTYTYLKSAADNNVMIGNWEHKKVYAISKEDLCESSASFAYVIYDDNNLLYYDGKIYGRVGANGDVDLCKARTYTVKRAMPQVKEIPRAETPKEAPAADTSTSGIVADVALEALVEDTLKDAREVSIDGLLKGFNYGLE